MFAPTLFVRRQAPALRLRCGTLFFLLLRAAIICSFATAARGQITLSGSLYVQDFNSLASGLPSGWSVSTGATANSLGTTASFTSAATPWNAATAGTEFRNIASFNLAAGASTSAQHSSVDRALGWRPLTAAGRNGAVTLAIANTTGFTNFGLNFSVFTGNNVASDQSYVVEYRVGEVGSFVQLGNPYTTGAPLSIAHYYFGAPDLSAFNDQSEPLYLRFRGVATGGSGSLDTLGIDNVQLSFSASAIPEPSTYAAVCGALALLVAALRRRKASERPAEAAIRE